MKTLTVFTPTYNRAYLLPRLYESLCRQSSKDFSWMVIDDGSTDDTKGLVQTWISENKIQIEYHYKANGGMHTGHNLAYAKIETELNVCIDSDDYMPDDAVGLILNRWREIGNKSKTAGIIGLDADTKGKIIGSEIPKHLEKGSLHDLYHKHNVTGDKKLVLRTDIVRKYPAYPEYTGEKLVPLGVLYLMIGKDFDFAYANEVYCIVEYQEEGSSHTIFKQYKQSPRGFAYARKVSLKITSSVKDIIKDSVHLVSCGIFAKDLGLIFSRNPYWFLSFLFLPIGLLLNFYIRLKS